MLQHIYLTPDIAAVAVPDYRHDCAHYSRQEVPLSGPAGVPLREVYDQRATKKM